VPSPERAATVLQKGDGRRLERKKKNKKEDPKKTRYKGVYEPLQREGCSIGIPWEEGVQGLAACGPVKKVSTKTGVSKLSKRMEIEQVSGNRRDESLNAKHDAKKKKKP